jgi:hypothetical protein
MKISPHWSWIAYFAIELITLNVIKTPLFDGNIHLSFSLLFLLNTGLLFWKPNFKVFFLLELLSILIFALSILPHFYFFNIYSFIGRFNYIWLKPREFSVYFLYVILALFLIFAKAKGQFNLVKNHLHYSFEFTALIVLLFCFRFTLRLIIIPCFQTDLHIHFRGINDNHINLFVSDLSLFKKGAHVVQPYSCEGKKELSPSIHYFLKQSSNKELLLIIESWGELLNPEHQAQCIQFLQQYLKNSAELERGFSTEFGRTCFHGNTSSAEARELLNMNNEESYRAFLELSRPSPFNLVKSKIEAGYHTIAAFPASKKYGSNYSNAEGFRKKLHFQSRFYYEELIENKSANVNKENGYTAVFDEDMIDSLMNESKNYPKVFAYGLSINTHSPFNLDKSHVDTTDYQQAKQLLIKSFRGNELAFNQFYRIAMVIRHTLNRLEKNPDLFDRILIVGDHSYRDLRCLNLYNKEFVPYLVLTKNNHSLN